MTELVDTPRNESSQEYIYSYQEALEASKKYFNGNELAAKVFVDKYALRDNNQNLREKTPQDMHRRMAKKFAEVEENKYKNTKIKPLTEDEIFDLFKEFKSIIPQGSPMYGVGNPYQIVSSSNCFVIESPADSYGGICKADEELVQISKRRGGVGVDISNLRPNGATTHNAARTSTGIISFASRFSNSIREVGQSGRRGALMQSIDIQHPESVIPWDNEIDGEPYEVEVNNKEYGNFKISSKYFNPNKIDFATCKYDRSKVTGANISIKLRDNFMKAVEEEGKFVQKWPIDSKNPRITKEIDAAAAWDKIIHSAWQTAEPGLLFWDNIINNSPSDCYADDGFETISTNPCGELPLSSGDSCRLMVINLLDCVKNPFTKNAEFDFDKLYSHAHIAQRLMDDLVDIEEESILKIIDKVKKDPESEEIKSRELNLWNKVLYACQNGRRSGTGVTALGDTLAAIGVKYGSPKSIEIVEQIFRTLKLGCYSSSVDMAEVLGPFPIWDYEKEKNNPFLLQIKEEDPDLYARMKRFGRRNISLLTCAPTGSVSIMAKLVNYYGTTSGVEPAYTIEPYTRRKKGNPGDKDFRSDFVDQNGDHWQEFKVFPSDVLEWMEISGETDLEKSPWDGCTAMELDWKQRVHLQAAAQRNIDHSISSTINLPNDVTVNKVKEIYMEAWKAGCKGVTVYRDGCRSGVLVSDKEKTSKKTETFVKTHAPKRPKELPCDIYHISVKGEKYFVLVGLYEDQPYEVFAGKNGQIKKSIKSGILRKIKRGEYSVIFDNGETLGQISDCISDEEEAITRMTSTALRHGTDISFIVHQLEKTKGDMTGFAKSVARALKKYIPDGKEVSGEECATCGANLIRQDGCILCPSCGYTKCG